MLLPFSKNFLYCWNSQQRLFVGFSIHLLIRSNFYLCIFCIDSNTDWIFNWSMQCGSQAIILTSIYNLDSRNKYTSKRVLFLFGLVSIMNVISGFLAALNFKNAEFLSIPFNLFMIYASFHWIYFLVLPLFSAEENGYVPMVNYKIKVMSFFFFLP